MSPEDCKRLLLLIWKIFRGKRARKENYVIKACGKQYKNYVILFRGGIKPIRVSYVLIT